MRSAILILLFIPALASGQFWENNKKSFAILGVQMASITLDAAGDALYDIGKQEGSSSKQSWGHTLQATAVGVNVLLLPMIDWKRPVNDGIWMAVSYVSLRYAMFDMTYNAVRGWDLLYADGIKAEMLPGGRAFTQSIAFGFSIAIFFKEF